MQETITRDFTATTFVVSRGRTLLLWHNKMQAWLPPGGHIDNDELPEDAARREVLEESGLDVELLEPPPAPWGDVRILHRPVCVLLENIEPGHQHIDLIYFARALSERVEISRREAAEYRWFAADDLDAPEVADDIRALGLQALEASQNATGTPPTSTS